MGLPSIPDTESDVNGTTQHSDNSAFNQASTVSFNLASNLVLS